MELKFDKEIDAILRKARNTRGVLVGDDPPQPKKHLDADTVAAFAEDALPLKAKLLYTEHFADCDPCRRMLSQAIFLTSEAADAGIASTSVSASVAGTSEPWYRDLFKTPNLALAMGALVIAFGGILGYVVLQNRTADSNATVSQITETEPTSGIAYFDGDAANTSANVGNTASAASNAMAPATTTANTNSAAMAANRLPSATEPITERSDSGTVGGAGKAIETPADMREREVSKPTAVLPPPAPFEEPLDSRGEKKAESVRSKDDDGALAKRKQMGAERQTRDLPASPSKSGLPRSGPIQNNQTQLGSNNVFDMSVTRTAGGKKFENRNGAWYDTAYRGQSTSNYRRGTDEYKKLDSGLRNIADTIGGTVVVVWKAKAYRIQ